MTATVDKNSMSTSDNGRLTKVTHKPSSGSVVRRSSQGSLRLDRDEALRYLGYSGQHVDSDLLSRFERIAEECERDLRPSWVYAMFDVDGGRKGGLDGESRDDVDGSETERPVVTRRAPAVRLLGTPLALLGHDIADHVRGARKVALMACTLGIASERTLRTYAAVSPTDALLYDAAASALVEAAANEADAEVAAWADERGLHAGSRFSPGYGDFPLSVQPAFLAAIDATRRIGLTATESFMLVPAKSVTAVIGLFDRVRPEGDAHVSCDSCALRDHCRLAEKGGTCRG